MSAPEAASAFRSLWQDTAEPPLELAPLAGEARCDVAVIGAGFTGLAAAIALAGRGASVVVLEAGEGPGFGASGRNGGQVIPGLKEDPRQLVARFGRERGAALAAFAGRTADVLFDLVARKAIACNAVRNGWIQGATHAEGLRATRARAEDWAAHGADVAAIGREETAALTGHGAYLGAFLDRRGGHVQPLSLARGMARAAIADGARIHARTSAAGFERTAGGWRIATDGGRVEAKAVIVATAGYSGELLPKLKRSMIATNSFQIATEPLPPQVLASILPGDQAVSEARNLVYYYRRDRMGRLVFGGRGSFRDPSGAQDFADLEAAARRMFPQIGAARVTHRWFGRFAATRDHLPHLHRLGPGLVAWLGCNGRGVALATAMGPLAADLALGAAPESLPVPVTELRAIPFHALQTLYVAAFTQYYALRDARG